MLFYRFKMGIAHFGTALVVQRHLLPLPGKRSDEHQTRTNTVHADAFAMV